MSNVAGKKARFAFRTTVDHKTLIERAAHLQAENATVFARKALTDAAQKVIQEHEALRLEEADREAFVAALLNPPAPNAHLRETVAIGKRLLGDD